MEEIGKVVNIIYYNDKNGYTIFLLRTNEKTVTCVGYVPYIKVRDSLTVQGEYVTHSVYGKQFKIATFEKNVPTSDEELLEYLSSGVIKGLGEKTAQRIIDKFGQDSIEIIKNEPEKLADIKGVSLKKAKELQTIVNSDWYFLKLAQFLNPYGIGATNIKKVFQALGENSLNLIYEDPYMLLDIVYGVEFSYIDKIASDLNFEKDNVKRIRSGVKYCLLNSLYKGNTCAKYLDLIEAVVNFLNVPVEAVENCIIQMINQKDIVIEYRDKEDIYKDRFVYLYNIYNMEQDIADIVRTKSNEFASGKDVKNRLEKIQKRLGIELTQIQKDAIIMAYSYNLSVITGGPGTGKTTIIQCLLKLFQQDNQEVALCAPTGRAAKRITEVTGAKAKTIHRLLELNRIEENMDRVTVEVNEIYKDVVIVDEASMLDTVLFCHILKAIQPHTKLILIGDADQLPSVGAGDILRNLIGYDKIKYIYLSEIFRQAKESLIVVNAHQINKGQMPNLFDRSKDFFFIPLTNQQDVANEIVELCEKRLKEYGNYDVLKDIQVISPTKKGIAGTKELNKLLQERLNKKTEYKPEKTYGQTTFRVGDKVMHIKNNYEIEWKKGDFEGKGIFNGDMGFITDYNELEGLLEVTFDDDRIAQYTSNNIEELEHAYAITVHKSQGSEFEVVVMPIVNGPPMLYTRNLLYTAITRAKKLLVIVGDEYQVKKMIDNVQSKKRHTGLEYKLNN